MTPYRREQARRLREAGVLGRILRRRQIREAPGTSASIATTSRGIWRPRGAPQIRRSHFLRRMQLRVIVASIIARRLLRMPNTRRAAIRATRASPPEHVHPGAGTLAALVPQGGSDHGKAAFRLSRELHDFKRDPPEGCTVELVDSNLFKWRATITGPKDTPYEGGTFVLSIDFDTKYPFVPPSVYFVTKIYHCNVAACGYICMDILTGQWSPILTVAKVLLSVMSLLSDPNPDDPLDPDIAEEFKWERSQHDETARNWTNLHAQKDQSPQRPSPE